MSDYEIFHAGDVLLQCGIVLPEVRVAYRTHGQRHCWCIQEALQRITASSEGRRHYQPKS